MKGKRKETSFSLKNTVIGLLVNLPVALLSLTCIFPVVWLLYSSLKTPQEFAKSVVALPGRFSSTITGRPLRRRISISSCGTV